MRVLGISAFHRDSAAALVDRRSHRGRRLERNASRASWATAAFPGGLGALLPVSSGRSARATWTCIVFYEKPLRKFERLLASQLRAFPRSAGPFARSMFLWLGDRLWTKNRIASMLEVEPESHCLRRAPASPRRERLFRLALRARIDPDPGRCGRVGHGDARPRQGTPKLETLSEVHFPHSLGLFAQAIAQFLGFEPSADEDKLEELAGLGEPALRARDGRARARSRTTGFFSVDSKSVPVSPSTPSVCSDDRLSELLGPARVPGSPLRLGTRRTRATPTSRRACRSCSRNALSGLCRALMEREAVREPLFRRQPRPQPQTLNARHAARRSVRDACSCRPGPARMERPSARRSSAYHSHVAPGVPTAASTRAAVSWVRTSTTAVRTRCAFGSPARDAAGRGARAATCSPGQSVAWIRGPHGVRLAEPRSSAACWRIRALTMPALRLLGCRATVRTVSDRSGSWSRRSGPASSSSSPAAASGRFASRSCASPPRSRPEPSLPPPCAATARPGSRS